MDLPYTLVEHRPLQVGLIVLQSDESLEPDLRRLVPADVEVLATRVPSDPHVTSATLAAMEPVLTQAASLLPGGARFAAVAYGCTSGTAEIGVKRVHTLIREGVRTPVVTDPISALVAACHHLSLRRIGIVSPYVETVSATLRRVLQAQGIEVVGFRSFNQSEEAVVARIAPQSLIAATESLAMDCNCDAIFLSCTNLRALDAIAPAEQRIGRPVLSSNQALGWDLCRLAGVKSSFKEPQALWATPPQKVDLPA